MRHFNSLLSMLDDVNVKIQASNSPSVGLACWLVMRLIGKVADFQNDVLFRGVPKVATISHHHLAPVRNFALNILTALRVHYDEAGLNSHTIRVCCALDPRVRSKRSVSPTLCVPQGARRRVQRI